MSVPNEGYFRNVTCALNERSQCRSFQQRDVCTKLDICVFIKWPKKIQSILSCHIHSCSKTNAKTIPLQNTELYWSVTIKCLRWVMVMVLNATFKNISVISWLSVLFVEGNGPRKSHRTTASYWQTLSQFCIEYTS